MCHLSGCLSTRHTYQSYFHLSHRRKEGERYTDPGLASRRLQPRAGGRRWSSNRLRASCLFSVVYCCEWRRTKKVWERAAAWIEGCSATVRMSWTSVLTFEEAEEWALEIGEEADANYRNTERGLRGHTSGRLTIPSPRTPSGDVDVAHL